MTLPFSNKDTNTLFAACLSVYTLLLLDHTAWLAIMSLNFYSCFESPYIIYLKIFSLVCSVFPIYVYHIEQVCLMRLRFERYFPHHPNISGRWWEKHLSKRSLIKHTCSWRVNLLHCKMLSFPAMLRFYWQCH